MEGSVPVSHYYNKTKKESFYIVVSTVCMTTAAQACCLMVGNKTKNSTGLEEAISHWSSKIQAACKALRVVLQHTFQEN